MGSFGQLRFLINGGFSVEMSRSGEAF